MEIKISQLHRFIKVNTEFEVGAVFTLKAYQPGDVPHAGHSSGRTTPIFRQRDEWTNVYIHIGKDESETKQYTDFEL